MAFEIHEATSCDAKDLAEVFFSAFSDPFCRAILPPTPEVRDWVAVHLANGNNKASEHEVFLKLSDESGAVVAFAKWVRPYHAVADRDRRNEEVHAWPVGGDKALCERFFGSMAEQHRRIMGEKPHYFLDLLCVHSSFQGRGLGSKLLKWGLARADEESVEVYLCSSPDGKPLYLKNGFQSLDIPSPLPEYEQTHMIRPAVH
ncbi:hypothetical protein N7478_000171 [Penicillium angulare]|uniref:uncharacterized protein n=1 Tax=Penicillium angulare TaxID=116970 RepID=UPI002541DBA3|nr:uncharacterized protein N7478_000171 [Penicillium angulare]KAJ5290920.1 hypothetical protein N7478_000171 [Penicillium angulare]